MKLRVRGDSLRLRLTRTEVSTLAQEGSVHETMHAPGGALRYVIETRPDAPIGAGWSQEGTVGVLTVTLETAAVRAWADSEQVGFEAQQDLGDDRVLAVLVEKDFACLVPRGEQDGDTYENPAASA